MIFNKLYKQENGVIDLIERALSTRSKLLITYLNQHCFNIYNSNKKYKNHLDESFEVFLDGIGIYLALKLFGYQNVQRFNATDLNEKIFDLFSKQQTSLFLIGGKFNSEFIKAKAIDKNINVIGYQNGYLFQNDDRPMEEELQSIVGEIKNTSPKVIVIAVEVPKQEILAYKLRQMTDVELILCVGGFLEFYFETKKRAPKIFRALGLEWIYRLIKEPSRLWKRYLIGIPVFYYNIFNEYLRYKNEVRN